MTDRNIQRLAAKLAESERARERQADTITRLNRRVAARERAIQALEAREAARGAKTARPAPSGPHSKREGHPYE